MIVASVRDARRYCVTIAELRDRSPERVWTRVADGSTSEMTSEKRRSLIQ